LGEVWHGVVSSLGRFCAVLLFFRVGVLEEDWVVINSPCCGLAAENFGGVIPVVFGSV